MKRSIFISRDLPQESHLLSYLLENGWTVYHRSLIDIVPIKYSIEKETDWIFLSSSNGARILFDNYQPPANTKIGVVGNATAETVRIYGMEPSFIGDSSDMAEVGRHFVPILGHKTVTFFGALGGSEKLRSELPPKQVFFIPIYRTKPERKPDIPETEVVYLTSPSNAKAYLSNHPLEGKIVIAIGTTTAEFLHTNGIEKVLIPSAPTEEHVIGLLRGL